MESLDREKGSRSVSIGIRASKVSRPAVLEVAT
jgi:hypothetical protein